MSEIPNQNHVIINLPHQNHVIINIYILLQNSIERSKPHVAPCSLHFSFKILYSLQREKHEWWHKTDTNRTKGQVSERYGTWADTLTNPESKSPSALALFEYWQSSLTLLCAILITCCYSKRERETYTHTHTQRQTYTQRETDIHTQRQTYTHTHRQTDRHTHTQMRQKKKLKYTYYWPTTRIKINMQCISDNNKQVLYIFCFSFKKTLVFCRNFMLCIYVMTVQ